MVTKEQALTCNIFHYTGRHACIKLVGIRGGVDYRITQVRRLGKTQVWKRDLQRFRVPVKFGLYEYSAITNENAKDWHTADDCPVFKSM